MQLSLSVSHIHAHTHTHIPNTYPQDTSRISRRRKGGKGREFRRHPSRHITFFTVVFFSARLHLSVFLLYSTSSRMLWLAWPLCLALPCLVLILSIDGMGLNGLECYLRATSSSLGSTPYSFLIYLFFFFLLDFSLGFVFGLGLAFLSFIGSQTVLSRSSRISVSSFLCPCVT